MPHNYDRNHSPDKWTILGSIGEVISQTMSSYAIGQTIDTLFGYSEYYLGLSEQGITGFVIGAAITTFGGVYCHYRVNKSNQDYTQNFDEEEALITNKTKPAKTQLTTLDCFALFCDATGHTLEISAPLTYVITIISGDDLDASTKIFSLAGSLVLGMACAYSNVRTCKHFLLDGKETDQDKSADIWVNITAYSEAFSYITSNPLWIGEFVDTWGNYPTYALGLSKQALFLGISISICTTSASFYLHRNLNSVNQHGVTPLTPRDLKKSLTIGQRCLIGLDFFSHTSDIAPKMTFVAKLATKQFHFSRNTKMLIQLSSLFISGACTVAGTRTCQNNLKKIIKDPNYRPLTSITFFGKHPKDEIETYNTFDENGVKPR